MTATLYSTGCPKCQILIKKLNLNNINFTTISDTAYMLSKGFTSVPMLEVDDKIMNFAEANKWINERNN